VAGVGLALTGAGCLLLTQVSASGSPLGDILFGLLIFGPGLGATYVAASIATLAGVAEREAGLASALNNAAFQIGGARHRRGDQRRRLQHRWAKPLAALTERFRSSSAASIFPALGLLSR
jgi:hypothetical protein